MGIDQVEHESAFTLRLRRSHPEHDREVVLPRTGPGVVRPGMDVGPIPPWVGLAHDEETLVGILPVIAGRERELPVVTVLGSDCPKQGPQPRL